MGCPIFFALDKTKKSPKIAKLFQKIPKNPEKIPKILCLTPNNLYLKPIYFQQLTCGVLYPINSFALKSRPVFEFYECFLFNWFIFEKVFYFVKTRQIFVSSLLPCHYPLITYLTLDYLGWVVSYSAYSPKSCIVYTGENRVLHIEMSCIRAKTG